MTHRKPIRKEHTGRPVEFSGFDGKTYHGHLIEVRRRGIRIRYYVPQVFRDCDAHILNADLKRVTIL